MLKFNFTQPFSCVLLRKFNESTTKLYNGMASICEQTKAMYGYLHPCSHFIEGFCKQLDLSSSTPLPATLLFQRIQVYTVTQLPAPPGPHQYTSHAPQRSRDEISADPCRVSLPRHSYLPSRVKPRQLHTLSRRKLSY